MCVDIGQPTLVLQYVERTLWMLGFNNAQAMASLVRVLEEITIVIRTEPGDERERCLVWKMLSTNFGQGWR